MQVAAEHGAYVVREAQGVEHGQQVQQRYVQRVGEPRLYWYRVIWKVPVRAGRVVQYEHPVEVVAYGRQILCIGTVFCCAVLSIEPPPQYSPAVVELVGDRSPIDLHGRREYHQLVPL